uniref:hypothetical protein n=1 Tax=Vulcanisaeta souniana TaxID=164452 RepID=UPI000A5C7FB5
NIRLADALNELGLDCRPERVSGRRRPDIRCFHNGLIIGIEASYQAPDAEGDARNRVDQGGLVDLAIALHYPIRYRDVAGKELVEQIKRSQFNVKIIVPKYVKMGSLLQFIIQQLGGRKKLLTEWFAVDIPTLINVIKYAVEYLIQESEVEEELENTIQVINNFVDSLKNRGVYEGIYEVMYRLYGMQSPRDEELVLAQAALSSLLTATFYEHIRNTHPRLGPLSVYVEKYGAIEGFKRALDELLKIDYREAVRLAREILDRLPSNATGRVRDLIDKGVGIAQNRTFLRRDFAGRVYHRITGDIATRKGFATFYTQVPAAYLLATLA